MSNFSYVNRHYGVPAAIGRRVIVDGEPGIIVEDHGSYIGVNFDKDEPSMVVSCHPTWHVEYQGMDKVRKRTDAEQMQQRMRGYGV